MQDTRCPELYLGAFKLPGQAWQTGKYTDFVADADLASVEEQEIWERRPLDCVALPNISAWAFAALRLVSSTPASEQLGGEHTQPTTLSACCAKGLPTKTRCRLACPSQAAQGGGAGEHTAGCFRACWRGKAPQA